MFNYLCSLIVYVRVREPMLCCHKSKQSKSELIRDKSNEFRSLSDTYFSVSLFPSLSLFFFSRTKCLHRDTTWLTNKHYQTIVYLLPHSPHRRFHSKHSPIWGWSNWLSMDFFFLDMMSLHTHTYKKKRVES